MIVKKVISNQAKEDFLKNLSIPQKGGTFSIHSIVNNRPIRINDLPLKPYQTILNDPNIDSLISLVNTLTSGMLNAQINLKNKPRKIHYQIK